MRERFEGDDLIGVTSERDEHAVLDVREDKARAAERGGASAWLDP